MPLPDKHLYTADDYWNLPDEQRAELIDGQLFNMSPPSLTHQTIVFHLARKFADFIDENGGTCRVIPAPYAVNLNADDKTWIEPDISVVCNPDKLTERSCVGAPDFIVEVVSPSSRRMDYFRKAELYADAGVHEYWIVDPMQKQTTVYLFEADGFAPVVYLFSVPITIGRFAKLRVKIESLLK